MIPDYTKKSRERQSENDKLRKTVLFSDLFYTVNVWHKRFELMNHKE